MINLAAIRNNLAHEIEASKVMFKDHGKQDVFTCTMGLAEVILKALEMSIADIGVDENRDCYVGRKVDIPTSISKVFSDQLEECYKDLNDLDNAETCEKFGTCSPSYIKEERVRLMGRISGLIKAWSAVKYIIGEA